jgi:molybdenum cofactor cytidylyltransferase
MAGSAAEHGLVEHGPVAAVLLAGGASRRFGARNKLFVEIAGTVLLRRIAERILAAGIAPLVVVTGAERTQVEGALEGLPVSFAANPNWSDGMGTSVTAGVSALPRGIAGAFVVPGDLPNLSTAMLQRLTAEFVRTGCTHVVVPVTANGAQRNPVLWPRLAFEPLQQLSGERGGKALLDTNAWPRVDVMFEDDSVFADIDTPDDLARYLAEPPT